MHISDSPVVTRTQQTLQLNNLLYTQPSVTGEEPALQQHILYGCPHDESGCRNMPAELPAYSNRPEPLPLVHCRLCLQECSVDSLSPEDSTSTNALHRGVHPAVIKHAREYHGLPDVDAYRRAVFSRVQKQWPEPVTAQTMRMAYDRYLH